LLTGGEFAASRCRGAVFAHNPFIANGLQFCERFFASAPFFFGVAST
jgi:hypothetical protein